MGKEAPSVCAGCTQTSSLGRRENRLMINRALSGKGAMAHSAGEKGRSALDPPSQGRPCLCLLQGLLIAELGCGYGYSKSCSKMEAAIRSALRDAGAQGVAISTNSFLPNQGSKRRVIQCSMATIST